MIDYTDFMKRLSKKIKPELSLVLTDSGTEREGDSYFDDKHLSHLSDLHDILDSDSEWWSGPIVAEAAYKLMQELLENKDD